MPAIVEIDFRVTQSLARDGTKYDSAYAVVVTKGHHFEELLVDEDQKVAIFAMTDAEVVEYAEGFASDTITGSRDEDEGIAVLGQYVRWQTLLPEASEANPFDLMSDTAKFSKHGSNDPRNFVRERRQ